MGVSPVFVRFAEVGPFASAFWRVALALPLLFAWQAWETRQSRTNWHDMFHLNKAVWLAGIFFAGDLVFWHLAIIHTTIANATFFACLAPFWVALFSGLLIGERVERAVFAGLVVSLVGATLLLGSSFSISPERVWGDIYGVITSLFFGLYFLAIRVGRRDEGPGSVTFKSGLVTAGILLGVTVFFGQSLVPHSLTGVAALLALGIISHSGGQGLLAVALGALSATFSSLVIFVEALAAALMGWLIFSENLTLLQTAGGLLIIAGIWVARPRQAPAMQSS